MLRDYILKVAEIREIAEIFQPCLQPLPNAVQLSNQLLYNHRTLLFNSLAAHRFPAHSASFSCSLIYGVLIWSAVEPEARQRVGGGGGRRHLGAVLQRVRRQFDVNFEMSPLNYFCLLL